MTAALAETLAPAPTRIIAIRPAPRREPPFDDERDDHGPPYAPFDRTLPFEPAARPSVWLPPAPRPSALPDPAPWARRLLIGMAEAAGGHRPVQQLAALLSPSVHRGLCADFDLGRQSGVRHWLHRASVRSVRGTEPCEGVAELSATVEAGGRVRAIALRLEDQHGRWRCTRLQLG
jgi:Family of unknown function (DUF6459)